VAAGLPKLPGMPAFTTMPVAGLVLDAVAFFALDFAIKGCVCFDCTVLIFAPAIYNPFKAHVGFICVLPVSHLFCVPISCM
jgi:hypothetical protein